MYQPKTGAKCSCKRGIERDNCPNCEGTGMVIDFAAIRAKKIDRTTCPHCGTQAATKTHRRECERYLATQATLRHFREICPMPVESIKACNIRARQEFAAEHGHPAR